MVTVITAALQVGLTSDLLKAADVVTEIPVLVRAITVHSVDLDSLIDVATNQGFVLDKDTLIDVFRREDTRPDAEKRSHDEDSKADSGSTDHIPTCVQTADEEVSHDGKQPNELSEGLKAERIFKHAFCRKVNVHFVGAWDTVSSIGFARGESHPDTTNGMSHVCHFRHALALDERRVKFLPEYVCGGASQTAQPGCNHRNSRAPPHTKEVWFPGTHSDVGGLSENHNQFSPPLAWMFMEASSMGLHLSTDYQTEYKFSWTNPQTESLKWLWWSLEYLPLSRLSYGNTEEAETRTNHWPHVGHGRQIVQGQRIHKSFFDQKRQQQEYIPKARLYDRATPWAYLREDDEALIEPWGSIEQVQAFPTTEKNTRRSILQKLREDASSEAGKHGLRQAGLFHALKTLFDREDDLHEDDLDAVHDIFDEVYDGHLPEKLRYEDVQPRLSHILSDRQHRSFRAAHRFITDFTDFAPGTQFYFLRAFTTNTISFMAVLIGVFHKGYHRSPVIFASFWGNDSSRVIAASEDGRIRVWNVQSQTKALGLKQHDPIKSFTCSSDGKRAVSVSHHGTVYLWSLEQRKLLWEGRIPRGSAGPVTFTAEGELVVSAIDDLQLLIWRTKLTDMEPHKDLAHRLENCDPLKHPLGMEKRHLLDVSHLHLLSSSAAPQSRDAFSTTEIQGVATFNGKLIALSTPNGIEIYRCEHGERSSQPTNTLPTGGNIKTLAFSPDGEHLIAGGDDKQIRIWDTHQWHEKIVLSEHDSHINALSVSGDGKRIVSCAGDGTVHVWDAEVLLKGSHLHQPKGAVSKETEAAPVRGTGRISLR
ncbi:hypothetical protein EIP86_005967 [Pleurotus ostreatoroseus]|nr:hypothetical protein EIP86_005967 [Pleurotus ostreatoroseus]